MRTAFIAAVSSIALTACFASADFQITDTRTRLTVGGQSYDKITFWAFNDGTGYTLGGTKLLAMDITVNSTGAMRFETGHVPDAFLPPIPPQTLPTLIENHTGDDIVLNTPSASLAGAEHTKLVGEIFSDLIMTIMPNNPSPETASRNGYDPVAAYSGLTSFAVVGAGLGAANGLPANLGLGAAFATVVTEVNAAVTVSGRIGGDVGTSGGISSASYSFQSVVVPEPTSLAALALAGLVARRRR